MSSKKSHTSQFQTFNQMGGRGKLWQLFGEESTALLEELNEILVA